MTTTPVERDERTTAIENAGYRWSYLVLSFGCWRSSRFAASLAVRPRGPARTRTAGRRCERGLPGLHRVLYKRWVILSAATLIVAALLAVVMVVLRH